MSSSPADPTRQRALKNRYRRILKFAALVLLESWWYELVLPKFGLRRFVARGRLARLTRHARDFRNLAADLGGLMIKVGQFLSSRLDVLPRDITRELENLQDEVAPEPELAIRVRIEEELSLPLSAAFAKFEVAPIAAASLGQVHGATLSPKLAELWGLEQVVVKVLRPGIEDIVDVDLAALRRIGGWLSRIRLVSRRADAPALVEEFAATTLEEIDYLNEAKNLGRFRENFAGDDFVTTPHVVWDRSTRRVLTLEDVSNIKVNDVDGLIAAGIDPNAVAAELARVTFQQIFVHGFFHADPHPGNVFVKPIPGDDETGFSLTFIDFGMMGAVSDAQRQDLQRFIFAVATRDARGWVLAVQKMKLLLPSADTVQLELAVQALFDRFAGVGVAEIVSTDPREFRDLAIQFSDLIRTLPFQIPENFLLLARSISIISGVTSSLNRDFNMWDALDPFARSLLQGGSKSPARAIGRELLDLINTAIRLPKRVENLSLRLERGEVSIRNPELERRIRRVERGQSSQLWAVFAGVLFLGGVLLRANQDAFGNTLMFFAAVPAIWALVSRRLP
jgi:predicted unusual protein kinase regulating ubiquinone biosynthesis (AarF/ABC1/UbiB family)